MTQIEIIIKNDQGQEISRLQSLNIELGNQTLNEIETAVEKIKQKILPEISKSLLGEAQREFTEQKKMN